MREEGFAHASYTFCVAHSRWERHRSVAGLAGVVGSGTEHLHAAASGEVYESRVMYPFARWA